MRKKFKIGQKVYCILNGKGKVTERYEKTPHGLPLIVTFEPHGREDSYTDDGKYFFDNVNASLLSLDEAVQRGYNVD